MSDFSAPELTLEAPIGAAKDDGLGFDSYATRLASLVRKAQTPFTVAIEGAWGSGKSSMMNLIKDHVQNDAAVITVSVWELATQEEVWHAFVQAMFNQVNAQVPRWRRLNWGKLGRWLLENIWRVLLVIIPLVVAGLVQLNGGAIFIGAVAAIVILWQTVVYPALKAGAAAVKPFDLNEMLRTPSYKEQISLLTELRTKFAKLVQATNRERIVVFIDDLDRCDAAQIPAVIEALKLFITVDKCIYVIGVDRGIVEKALMKERSLTADDAHAYLDKVVQLWFPMPDFDVEKARRYVTVQLRDVDLPEDVKALAPELFVALFHTPRRFKQAVNRYKALLAVRSSKMRAEFGELAVLQMFLIEQATPKLYAFLKTYPGYVYALWQHVYWCYQYDRDWYTYAYRDSKGQLAPGFRNLSIWRGHLKGLYDDDNEDKYSTPFETGRLTRDDVSAVILIVSKSPENEIRGAIFPREVQEWVDCVNLTLPDTNIEERLSLARQVRSTLSDVNSAHELKQTQIKGLAGAEARIEALARDWRGYDSLRVFNSVWLLRAYDWFRLTGVFVELMHATDLRGANLVDAQLQRANLYEARLQGANLSGTNLEGASLNGVQLQGANLDVARLEGAVLGGAQMKEAYLYGARLEGANLYGAQLEGANFYLARLEGADLTTAQLEGADLTMAQLEGANFYLARLEGANLYGAQLEGAILSGAVLLNANLEGTSFSAKTILPDAESRHDAAGNLLTDDEGKWIFDKSWTSDTDMSRYTNPEHPEFYLPEWYKEQRARAAKKEQQDSHDA